MSSFSDIRPSHAKFGHINAVTIQTNNIKSLDGSIIFAAGPSGVTGGIGATGPIGPTGATGTWGSDFNYHVKDTSFSPSQGIQFTYVITGAALPSGYTYTRPILVKTTIIGDQYDTLGDYVDDFILNQTSSVFRVFGVGSTGIDRVAKQTNLTGANGPTITFDSPTDQKFRMTVQNNTALTLFVLITNEVIFRNRQLVLESITNL